MKIRSRLLTLVTVSMTGLLVTAGMMSWMLNDLRIGGQLYNQIINDKDLLADILPPPEYIIEAELTLYQLSDTANATKQARYWQTMDRLQSEYQQREDFWKTQPLSKEISTALQASQNYGHQFFQKLAQLKQVGIATPEGGKLIAELHQLYDAHRAEIDQLVKLSNDHFNALSVKSDGILSSHITLIIFILLSIITLVLWVGISTLARVTKPVDHLVKFVQGVIQSGDFNRRSQLTDDDEISEIAQTMDQLLISLNQVMTETNKVIGAIANADFSQRMTGHYVGDFDKLKQGVNQSANSVSFMIGELEKVMNGLNAGKFDIRMDNKVPTAFRQLVETALNNISGIIGDINTAVDQMNKGNFDAKVKAEAQGDLLVMKNNFNQSLDEISRIIKSIVMVVEAQAQGDLTTELPDGIYQGTFHHLKNAMNYSADKVKSSVVEVIQVSNIVNDAASQVSQGSEDLSRRVQEQAAALEQTSSTMHEMTSAIQTNTANARRVSELASQVQHQTNEGVSVMQETITAMQAIKASSSKIADIVTIIDGIAFQTNLLALNAAVEAARAGEHGRGFAVVAGEVRALAQKSAEAAKDIKDLITDSVHRIETGTHLADKSGEMLSGITGSIEQVTKMIEEISTASHEQSVGIGQVHQAISNIDRVTQENAALVEETSAAAESLSTEAHRLQENMAFFKTGASMRTPTRTNTHTPAPAPKRISASLPAPSSIGVSKSNEWSDF
jgi:methyl-accepting chemotaxis protein